LHGGQFVSEVIDVYGIGRVGKARSLEVELLIMIQGVMFEEMRFEVSPGRCSVWGVLHVPFSAGAGEGCMVFKVAEGDSYHGGFRDWFQGVFQG